VYWWTIAKMTTVDEIKQAGGQGSGVPPHGRI
jgi:hypothetical protein